MGIFKNLNLTTKIPYLNRLGQDNVAISFSCGTDKGLVRQRNEDSVVCLAGEELPLGIGALSVVADGMGGHSDGDVASRMAVDKIKDLVVGSLAEEGPRPEEISVFMRESMESANVEIHREGLEKKQALPMGTTCTMALVVGKKLYLAHVGDSRAYLLRNRKLRQLTTDDSWVEEQVAMGLISIEQARTHPQRNIVTQALGTSPTIDVETTSIELRRKDKILLCTDGLHGLVENEDIESILRSPNLNYCKDQLIDIAKENGGNDNVTVAVIGLN